MTLGELIRELGQYNRDTVVTDGFGSPHSYRGYYEDLAFEPMQDTTVGAMLDCAKSALGATYHGYKGGEYTMREYTDVWLAEYGSCDGSEKISPQMLRAMIEMPALRAENAELRGLLKEAQEYVDRGSNRTPEHNALVRRITAAIGAGVEKGESDGV